MDNTARSRNRRGTTAAYLALALPVLGMFSALGLETMYLRLVHIELQGVSDAASHAAMLQLDGTTAGIIASRADAIAVVVGSRVNLKDYAITEADVILGTYDVDTGAFIATDDPSLVNSVKVPLVETNIGLGLGEAFFGQTWSVTACSAVMAGSGNANTGIVGGPGLANGHFDYDTTDARVNCAGSNECYGTAKHTHEFDDDWDVTWADQFSDQGGHLPIDGCTSSTVDKKGKLKTTIDSTCVDAAASRTIADAQTFKIIVVNADLSPGAWITINGVDHDVTDYDDTAFADLPTYSLGGGGTLLSDFQMNFDVNAIANCELIPTNTGDMKKNTPGIDGEWRSGALTVQFVTTGAASTGGRSAGDQDVVISENAGLLYETTYFWHWDGPSYIAADAVAWQSQYDLLNCGLPIFIDQRAGGAVCGG